jgi:hypothetical protein
MITKTSCPHCGQHVEFEAENANNFILCPSCKKLISVGQKKMPTPNVANALRVFAVIEFAGAVLLGLMIGSENGPLGLGVFAGCVLGGCVLFGFASIIEHTKSSADSLKRIETILERQATA